MRNQIPLRPTDKKRRFSIVNKEQAETVRQFLEWPIPWDPSPDPWVVHWDRLPSWVKLDDKMQRQFAQMELKFMKMELDIWHQKLQELGNILGTPIS